MCAAFFDPSDAVFVASYAYGPFGEVIRATGPMAKLNPFRFSTKYTDDEDDLVYYGYRYYNPSTGRWLSRDPLLSKSVHEDDSEPDEVVDTENGQMVFVNNDPISQIDAFGLWPSASPWYGMLINGGTFIPFTHENANNRVIPGSSSDIATLNAATVFVDGDQGASYESTAKHAMSSPGEPKQLARVMANLWVAKTLTMAQQNLCPCTGGNRQTALWYFGLALHTVQNSTSPAHHGFQKWRGLSTLADRVLAIHHVARECFDPGTGSNLDKATAWLWSFLQCPAPSLPPDFFMFPADHGSWYN